MRAKTRSFAESLKECGSVDAAGELLQHQLRAIGYDQFVYAMIPTFTDGSLGEYVTVNNLDPEWMQTYVDEGLYQADFAIQHCMQNTRTLLWSEMYEHLDAGKITPDFAKSARIAADVGVGKGLTIPLRQVGYYTSGISLVADKDVRYGEINSHFASHNEEILELVNTFHAAIDRSILGQTHYNLSPREIEMLRWLSEGLLEKEISFRTGRAVSTIEKQVRSARRKLYSSTTTQAVAKAVMFDLI